LVHMFVSTLASLTGVGGTDTNVQVLPERPNRMGAGELSSNLISRAIYSTCPRAWNAGMGRRILALASSIKRSRASAGCRIAATSRREFVCRLALALCRSSCHAGPIAYASRHRFSWY
jgi:hypothetical protein